MQFVFLMFLFVTMIRCEENTTAIPDIDPITTVNDTIKDDNSTAISANVTTSTEAYLTSTQAVPEEVPEDTEFYDDTYETVTVPGEHLGRYGIYGGFYPDNNKSNPFDLHAIHGTIQSLPEFYYSYFAHRDKESERSSLDYYLLHGLSKFNNSDFKYDQYLRFNKVQHLGNGTANQNATKNEISTIIQVDTKLPSDVIITCHPSVSGFCPENTENMCLFNGTIFCVSKLNVTYSCLTNRTCVDTTVPCVYKCRFGEGFGEITSLKCLSILEIVDVYELRGTTLTKVGGTFAIVPALSLEERTYCVTVISNPLPPK